MLFHATGDRWYHATRSEGGGVAGFRLKIWRSRFPLYCLIPLWLSPVNRPAMSHEKKKSCAESAPPPKPGGHADTDSATVWHTSIRPHDGSLSASFIPAGRLGNSPPEGAPKAPLLQSLLQSPPFPSRFIVSDRSSPSRVRFAASRPGTAPGRSERRAAYEGKGGGAGRGVRRASR